MSRAPIKQLSPEIIDAAFFDTSHFAQSESGLFLAEAILAHDEAYQALGEYPVKVVSRTTHKDPETVPYGEIRQETVRYSDGAVRLATITTPNQDYRGERGVSPYVMSSGDPWITGPDGLNRIKIEQYTEAGFGVVWQHHQGRHAVWPTSRARVQTMARFLSNKSVGRSAYHDHALLDDLDGTVDFRVDHTIREGFSRSAMAGKAYIALCKKFGRVNVWADLDADCFEHSLNPAELLHTGARQLVGEATGLARLIYRLTNEALETGDNSMLEKLAGTFDAHPLNMIHEAAWIPLLINGDSGALGAAMPLDAAGVNTLFSRDWMSQSASVLDQQSVRPFFEVLHEDGPHIYGAYPEYLDKKLLRFDKVMTYMILNDMSLTGIRPSDVVPELAACNGQSLEVAA